MDSEALMPEILVVTEKPKYLAKPLPYTTKSRKEIKSTAHNTMYRAGTITVLAWAMIILTFWMFSNKVE